jgi:hypothetical protein
MGQSHASFLELAAIEQILDPASRNNNTFLSAVIDMAGYEHVDIQVVMGATDCLTDVKLTESVNADGSAPTDVSGAALTQISATGDNKSYILSVAGTKLSKRYLVVSSVVSNATGAIFGIVSYKYPHSGEGTPVTQAAGDVGEFKKVTA